MSRRSTRLLSGGYYNSDEESDSSSVTNISYRENPVKVFKKKAGARKPSSRTSSRANSNASSPSAESPAAADQCDGPRRPSPSSSPPQAAMRTEPYVFTTATPRPALTPSSSSSLSPAPARCPSVPPKTSLYAGRHSSTCPGLHLRPNHKELIQSGVDSSGYSSSEGIYKRPAAGPGGSGGRSSGYRTRISGALYRLIDSASLMAAAAQARVKGLTAAANARFTSHVKKACGLLLFLLLLLLLLLLCFWFLTSFISRMSVAKTPSQPESRPGIPAATLPPPAPPLPLAPAPAPQPNTMHHASVVDPAVVSAAVESKMQHLLAELLLKQEQLFSQMKERMTLDLRRIKAGLDAVDSDTRLRLKQEVAGLGRTMVAHQADSRSAADGLSLRIQAVEAENAKLSQELSSIQLTPPPPPAPCPEALTPPAPDHLTPELQQAMEKWLSDRIQEQDVLRLGDGASGADFGRPAADKMADFALETQGASVISTRCSETYRIRSACVTLFGFPLWYPSESPRTVIQGHPVLLPGRCWAFHGVQGTLVLSLSHPVTITHVTLDHLPRCNSPTGRIDSAPKDFEVHGMADEAEGGALLGTFTYDEDGESTQTFQLLNPTDEVYRFVELRVLSNWGHVEYTCLYRFRVHGKMAST